MNEILSISDYVPDYIERDPKACPHCGGWQHSRTNRYLFRCGNPQCGRYY